jgi:hypothetical protein
VTELTNAKRRTQPLFEGTKLRCPRCKDLHNLLAYVPLMEIEEYQEDTVPIYKCPSCRWMFALAPRFQEVFVNAK